LSFYKISFLDAKNQETPKDPKTEDLQDSVKGRCVEVSQDGKIIVVGFKDGTVKVSHFIVIMTC
jgi:hypothetical protein